MRPPGRTHILCDTSPLLGPGPARGFQLGLAVPLLHTQHLGKCSFIVNLTDHNILAKILTNT